VESTFGRKADNLKKRPRKEDEESVRFINKVSLCSSCILICPSPLSFGFNFWLCNEKFIAWFYDPPPVGFTE